MRSKYLLCILVMLALALPASPAHAGGVVTVCDEAHLLAALAGGGTVTFACSGMITLTATITISADTTIDGSGQGVTISGNHAVRVFKVNQGVILNLDKLTVANGNSSNGAGIVNYGTLIVENSTFSDNNATSEGGGIRNFGGTVTISTSTFSENSAIASGSGGGGGINNGNGGTLTVINTAFSENRASSGSGGGIKNHTGTLTVLNSTFSDNFVSAGGGGGGVLNYNGTTHVSNSTFYRNISFAGGGGGLDNGGGGVVTVTNSTFLANYASVDRGGGGIRNYDGTVSLKNTIVTHSASGGNCLGNIIDGNGNLSYPDTTCPGINGDPRLGPLQDNGGPTWTMALGWGSAAIDTGNDAICAAAPVNNLDQRGVARPQGAHCDIGAVEQTPYPPLPPRLWLPTVLSQS